MGKTMIWDTGWPLTKQLFSFTIISILTFLPFHLQGQQYYTAETTYGLKLGKTKPLHSYYAIPPTDPQKLKELKRHKPSVIIPNFVGRRHSSFHTPDAEPKGPDPLWNGGQDRLPLVSIPPILQFEGIDEAAAHTVPPDVNGDIGRDFYVEIVNATSFRVYNKMGQAVSLLMNANSIWSQVGQSSLGDPILLYDQEVDRWLLTEFAPVNRRRVLLAVSENGDPRGSWTAYTFQTPQFPDFPKYGIWPNAYFLTTNENGINFPIYAFNREEMLAGEDTVNMQRLTVPKHFGNSFEVGQPVDWDGIARPPEGSPGLVVKINDDDWGTTPEDVIQLHKIHIDWAVSSNSNIEVVNIPTAPFDTDGCQLESTGGFSCIPQPNGQGIDGAEWIITNKAQYRNFGDHESFVMCFMVDVTGDDVAGMRWMEFRKTPVQDWHLYQEGTVGSDDGLHRFMGSIGIDGQGTIGLAYSVSGYNKYPSLRYTGRYSFDPLGEMSFEEYEFATGLGSQGQDRFGDYAAMSVDPADDATFWFVGQYLPNNSEWSTRIVAFTASRDSFDLSPVSVNAPVSSAVLGDQEPLQVTIRNQGLRTIYDFAPSYQFEGGSWVSDTANVDSLSPDQVYYHTFDSTLQFSGLGPYSLRIVSGLTGDDNRGNDTLDFTIIKYPHLDAALEYEIPTTQNVICSDESLASVLLRNVGGDTLYSALFEILVNGESSFTLPWTGSLAFGEETSLSVLVAGLSTGINTISMNVIDINGAADEIPDNNQIEWTTEARPEGQNFTLRFRTDNFPSESSWKLFDASGNIIASDGPFASPQQIYISLFCLDPEACYTFTVYDAFGDGMVQGIPKGDFEIFNEDGEVVAELAKPNFGDESSSTFCVTGECMLSVNASVIHESAPGLADALIMAETSNSLGIVTYSIDGGTQFQASPLFDTLAPGVYTVIVQDQAGCRDTVTLEILTCQLQALITTKPASGGDVGEIHVAVSGAVGSVSYSLNGGAFVSDSAFTMLEPGDYTMTVMDSLGCTVQEEVTVSTEVGTSTTAGEYFLRIAPNPGQGIYNIFASFSTNKLFVPYAVLSAQGEAIVHGALVRYDQYYRHELSLVAYPSGLYYILFRLPNERIIARVIKI